MVISCLGPAGSYSELAAKKLCPKSKLLLCKDFYEVVQMLVDGKSDNAVLPVENSIQGSVLAVLDILAEYHVFAIKQTVLQIDHRLALKEGVKISDIKRVSSHEQALAQCSAYLRRELPHAKQLHTNSTAESLSMLDGETAGIVGAHIKEEGVCLSGENIANDKSNCTRFLLLERRGDLPDRSSMVFFAAVTQHTPGALVEVLQIFARNNLNLTRIESRPLKGMFGNYNFFIELCGNVAEDRVIQAIREAKNMCVHFRLIGAYD